MLRLAPASSAIRKRMNKSIHLCGNAVMRQCRMTTVVPIGKRGTVTLPPAWRKKYGADGQNLLVIMEERGDELVLRPAAAVPVRDIPQEVIASWIAEDEAGMREFESRGRPA